MYEKILKKKFVINKILLSRNTHYLATALIVVICLSVFNVALLAGKAIYNLGHGKTAFGNDIRKSDKEKEREKQQKIKMQKQKEKEKEKSKTNKAKINTDKLKNKNNLNSNQGKIQISNCNKFDGQVINQNIKNKKEKNGNFISK